MFGDWEKRGGAEGEGIPLLIENQSRTAVRNKARARGRRPGRGRGLGARATKRPEGAGLSRAD